MYPKMPHMLAVSVFYVGDEVGRGRWAKSSMAARAERSGGGAGEEGYGMYGCGLGWTDRRSTNVRGLR